MNINNFKNNNNIENRYRIVSFLLDDKKRKTDLKLSIITKVIIVSSKQNILFGADY